MTEQLWEQQDSPLEWNKLQFNPVPPAQRVCLHFCSQMDISWTGTLPAGAAPGHVLLGYPRPERVLLHSAPCKLPAPSPACSQPFNQDQQFDCRMQNQLEGLMGMQEGNRKKKTRPKTPKHPHLHTSSRPKENSLKNSRAYFYP